MSMTQSSPDHAHVAVLAFPFGCHPWPLLNLTCKLAWETPHVRFSFFNTSKSNQRLFSTSQVNLPDNLKAYDVADGVPNGHVFTPGNPIEELVLFIKAAPESFGKAMDMTVVEFGRNISCLLTDAFSVFACEMAQNMNVKWVPFWVPAPYCLSAHIYTDIIHKTYANAYGNGNGGVVGGLKPIDKTLDVIPGLSTMRFCDLSDEVLQSVSNSSLFSQTPYRMSKVLPQASAIVMNSFQEINSTIIANDLKSKFQDVFYVAFIKSASNISQQRYTKVASSAAVTDVRCISQAMKAVAADKECTAQSTRIASNGLMSIEVLEMLEAMPDPSSSSNNIEEVSSANSGVFCSWIATCTDSGMSK